jgi:hypothetical protein
VSNSKRQASAAARVARAFSCGIRSVGSASPATSKASTTMSKPSPDSVTRKAVVSGRPSGSVNIARMARSTRSRSVDPFAQLPGAGRFMALSALVAGT